MHQTHDLFFRQFRLDVANERLWQRSQEITLRPKTFAVLRYLLEHADRLVTKQELLDAVWPDTAVSDVVPLVCIRELRKALNDEAGTPRFIETVPRRGYRFIAHVTHTPPIKSQRPTIKSRSLATSEAFLSPPPVFVGRETELGQLHEWLTRATVGDRQIIFISGESGIGKTALIEEFLRSASARQPLWIARGQCIEHYGAGEAYLPVLDALGRLYREMDGARLLEILQRYAPTWLGQMPSFLPEIDFDSLRGRIQGASRERMLREMAEAIEVLTGDSTTLELPVLVLWIEDLHWSDASTLDLLSFLARRQERARLLVLGTYRPAEVLVRKHPLLAMKQELQLHERSKELHLNLLSEQAVAEYLQQRGERELPQAFSLYALAGKIHRRTSGNPLFMVTLVSQLLGQCGASPLGSKPQAVEEFLHVIPETLRQMVEQQVSRLSPKEQHLLEIASVAGSEFSAATVAVGLGEEITGCEKCCEELARCGQFLRTRGVEEWPDGTLAGRYGFVHALYRDVLYDRLTASQRMELHRRIGERKEIAYGTKAKTIAAELAVHFAQGRDYYRAVRYLQKAAGNAVDRHAFQVTPPREDGEKETGGGERC